MPTAACFIPQRIPYRGDDFMDGLRRLGYSVSGSVNHKPKQGDVLVLWNRHMSHSVHARRYEEAGATILVAENGYLGRDWLGSHWYALAIQHHNGAGDWPVGGAERWDRLGVELLPWREGGEDVLVLPQRGIGAPGVAMPKDWPTRALERLRKATHRVLRVRRHPGPPPHPDLAPDLANAFCVATWGSGAAIKAIIRGVPAFYELPHWIGGPAAVYGFGDIERPFLGDRLPMLRRLAWAIWRHDEIRSGEAFAWLLRQ